MHLQGGCDYKAQQRCQSKAGVGSLLDFLPEEASSSALLRAV